MFKYDCFNNYLGDTHFLFNRGHLIKTLVMKCVSKDVLSKIKIVW